MVANNEINYEEYDSASEEEVSDSDGEEGEVSSDEEDEASKRRYHDDLELEWVDSERRSQAKVRCLCKLFFTVIMFMGFRPYSKEPSIASTGPRAARRTSTTSVTKADARADCA
jgi:hypothetical protein